MGAPRVRPLAVWTASEGWFRSRLSIRFTSKQGRSGVAEGSSGYCTPPRRGNSLDGQAEEVLIPSPPPSGPAMEDSPPVAPLRVSLSMLVVPEDMPPRPPGPLMARRFYFKFTSARSSGKSKRQEVSGSRQPVFNDIHVAAMHSDKVFAEKRVEELGKMNNSLREENNRLASLCHNALKDVNTAQDKINPLWQRLERMSDYPDLKRAQKNLETRAYA